MANIRPLSAALLKKSIEVNENPDTIQESIEILRDWIKLQPHITSRLDDQFLISFLRGCKFSIEKAKSKIDSYYVFRTEFIPKNRDINRADILEVLRLGIIVRLPKPVSEDGPRVTIFRLGKYEPSKFNILHMIEAFSIFTDVDFLDNDHSTISGEIFVNDLEDIHMGHYIQYDPMFMKRVFPAAQSSLPYRVQGIYFINLPKGFDIGFNMVKPLLNENMKKRVKVFSDKEEFYTYVPQKILPKEYNGNYKTVAEITENSIELFKRYRDHILDADNFGIDESKRLIKRVPNNNFGVDGTFRKMEID